MCLAQIHLKHTTTEQLQYLAIASQCSRYPYHVPSSAYVTPLCPSFVPPWPFMIWLSLSWIYRGKIMIADSECDYMMIKVGS